jgi:hypothetical protein
MSDPSGHLSPYQLDALDLGTLDAAPAERARLHVGACPRCQGTSAAMRAHRERFTTTLLPRGVERLRTQLGHRPATRLRVWSLALLLPTTAMAVVLHARARDARLATDPPGVLAKGEASLLVVARRKGRVFPASSAVPLGAGDQLRFVVQTQALPYVLIASVDGAGQASIYYPFKGTASAAITPGRQLELHGSVILDAAPGPERVFALFSWEPLPAAMAEAALRSIAAGGPDAIRRRDRLEVAAAAQRSVLLEKLP